jgi:hypothetical protein
MWLHPRKHPHSADEPVSPAEIAETLYAIGLTAWMMAPAPFLWAPPLWVLALMTPVERPPAPQVAAPARAVPVAAAIAQAPPEPSIATPLQAAAPARPRAVRAPRARPRPRRKEPR